MSLLNEQFYNTACIMLVIEEIMQIFYTGNEIICLSFECVIAFNN